MADTLFENEDQVDPNKNYLEELVGPDKKFKTPEELARGKVESDLFIPKIVAENAQLRDELKTRKSMEDFVNQIEAHRTTVPPKTDDNQEPERETPVQPQPAVDISSQIEKVFEERSKKSVESQNLSHVADVLEKNLGPGFATIVAAKGKELGVGLRFLDDLAKTQPKALFALIGVSENPAIARATPGAARANPGNAHGEVKNFAYYEKIRKTDPVLYNSLKMHKEMMAALTEQEDSFYQP